MANPGSPQSMQSLREDGDGGDVPLQHPLQDARVAPESGDLHPAALDLIRHGLRTQVGGLDPEFGEHDRSHHHHGEVDRHMGQILHGRVAVPGCTRATSRSS